MFHFKNKITVDNHELHVVYKIFCKKCDAEYTGKTDQILQHRINVHKARGKSNKLARKKHTDGHAGNVMDYENVKVIDQTQQTGRQRTTTHIEIHTSTEKTTEFTIQF